MAQKEVPHLGLTFKEQVSKEAGGGWRLGLEVDGGVKREGGVPRHGEGRASTADVFHSFFFFLFFF